MSNYQSYATKQKQGKLFKLVNELRFRATIGLSINDKGVELSELAKRILVQEKTTIIVGFFPHREFLTLTPQYFRV